MSPPGVSEISQTPVLCGAESRDEEGLPRWMGAGGEFSFLGSCGSPYQRSMVVCKSLACWVPQESRGKASKINGSQRAVGPLSCSLYLAEDGEPVMDLRTHLF